MSSEISVDFSARDSLEGVDKQFSERWSPRAFAEYSIDNAALSRIFDAARWSPSCFNDQPWLFYSSTPQSHDDFVSLLAEGNQVWAKNASVIGFVVANKNFAHNGKANAWAEFDCGAAWMSMCLQAQKEGLHTHGMGGIKKDEILEYLKLETENHSVLMGFVIGKMDDPSELPENLRGKESPSTRKALEQIWKTV